MSDLDLLTQALPMTGGDPALLFDAQTAHLLVSCHRVVSQHEIPGVKIQVAESPAPIVSGNVVIGKGRHIEKPVHMCYGIPRLSGEQEAKLELVVEDNAHATIFLHGLFPEVQDAAHRMDLSIHVGQGSSLTFHESHFHGPHGSMQVQTRVTVNVDKTGKYTSQLWLVKGRVGNVMRDSMVNMAEDAVAEVRATVFSSDDDEVRLKDTIVLSGCGARSMIETVFIVTDNAKADITATTEAHAPGAQGHMNYIGLVKDQGTAAVSPLAKVLHPWAKVTQEGVLGGMEKKALEALVARGLVPEDTAALVARGIVR